MDTQQSFAIALSNNPHSSLLSSPLPCVAYPLLSVDVGLIEAFRHRIKASGNIPLRSTLEAKRKEEIETKLIKTAQRWARRIFKAQPRTHRVDAFSTAIRKSIMSLGKKEKN